MKIRKTKKGFEISQCSREEWLEYKNKHSLFPACLYEIDRKPIYRLILPNGRKLQFCKRG
jgi:hypothetical protein